MYIRIVACPAEPKETGGKACAAEDDLWQTPFRNGDVVVGSKLPLITGLACEDKCTSKELASNHAKKRQASNTKVHTVNALKHQWVGRQEEVQEPVDEGHVDTEQQHNSLSDQHLQRPGEILLDQLSEVDFNFLLFGMDAPVLRPAAELGSLRDENLRRIRLGEEEQVKGKAEETHKGYNVLCPAVAEVGHDDETTYERCHERTTEYRNGEDGNGHSTSAVVKHVGKDGGDTSQRTSAKEATEEATD